MYLLALADTVANTKVDFSENDAADVAVKKGKSVFQQKKNNLNIYLCLVPNSMFLHKIIKFCLRLF